MTFFDDYKSSDHLLNETPMELWSISDLFQHQSNLSLHDQRHNNPFLVFLYLIGYHDNHNYLPYDYAPSDSLAYLELSVLAKALSTYSTNPDFATAYLDRLLELVDDEQLAESESL